jgi:hypothetical protein
MKIHSKTVIVTAVLLAAAVLVWRYNNSRRQQRIEAGLFTGQYETVIRKLRDGIRMVDRRMTQNGQYDPTLFTAPAVVHEETFASGTAEKGEASIVLQGISWNSDMPLAMINNRLYKTGDQIGTSTIVRIMPYGLILRSAVGTESEIRLVKEKTP